MKHLVKGTILTLSILMLSFCAAPKFAKQHHRSASYQFPASSQKLGIVVSSLSSAENYREGFEETFGSKEAFASELGVWLQKIFKDHNPDAEIIPIPMDSQIALNFGQSSHQAKQAMMATHGQALLQNLMEKQQLDALLMVYDWAPGIDVNVYQPNLDNPGILTYFALLKISGGVIDKQGGITFLGEVTGKGSTGTLEKLPFKSAFYDATRLFKGMILDTIPAKHIEKP